MSWFIVFFFIVGPSVFCWVQMRNLLELIWSKLNGKDALPVVETPLFWKTPLVITFYIKWIVNGIFFWMFVSMFEPHQKPIFTKRRLSIETDGRISRWSFRKKNKLNIEKNVQNLHLLSFHPVRFLMQKEKQDIMISFFIQTGHCRIRLWQKEWKR